MQRRAEDTFYGVLFGAVSISTSPSGIGLRARESFFSRISSSRCQKYADHFASAFAAGHQRSQREFAIALEPILNICRMQIDRRIVVGDLVILGLCERRLLSSADRKLTEQIPHLHLFQIDRWRLVGLAVSNKRRVAWEAVRMLAMLNVSSALAASLNFLYSSSFCTSSYRGSANCWAAVGSPSVN